MEHVHPYVAYYAPVITAHTTGIKLVHGGTGLGKTSGIADTIKHSQPGQKFIYCANRVQLLNEMAERLRRDAIPYVHLQNDTNMLYALIQGPGRDDLHQFLRLPIVDKYARNALPMGGVPDILKVCADLETCLNLDERSPSFRDFMAGQARTIINFVKRVLIEAHLKRNADHEILLRHPLVRSLFPYSEFRNDPTIRILLMTIQKSFYGFFDGKAHTSISTLSGDHGGHIMFLDEFDFLENNLTELICRDGQIDAPLKFVEYFYRAMHYHKLPSSRYLQASSLRERVEAIIEGVNDLRRHGLNYPDINQFTYTAPALKNVMIFETNRTILTSDVWLRPTQRSFHLMTQEEPGVDLLSVDTLFQTIHHAATDIVRLLKDVEVLDPTLHRELIQQCFDTTVFKRQLETIRQPPRLPRVQRTRFDTLLDRGYGLYDVHHLQHESDIEAVELDHYGIYTTPEKILLSLATNNLVFGLSATADIPRVVCGFADDWLRRQEGLLYHDTTAADQGIIQSLNAQKHEQRGNRMHVEPAHELDKTKPFERRLLGFIKAIAEDEGFGGDDERGYRRKRANRFFATLLWIAARPQDHGTETHLLFFNSYRQLKHIFTDHQHPEDDLFRITVGASDRLFQEYEIDIAGCQCSVLFYDAEQGQRINTNTTINDRYQQLFWRHKPVLIVTTYPSAGNGINLQYRPTPDDYDEQDIQHVHLLDSPYFYFGQPDPATTQQERNAVIKQNIWYLAKLFEGKMTSEQEFTTSLTNIRSPGLNSRYHTDPSTHMDSTLNQLATFIQAIGRVERVWRAMPDQTVRMSREVFEVFEIFSTRDDYATLREQRAPMLSNNLRQVFDHVAAQSKYAIKQMGHHADERLAEQNTRCATKLEELLNRLSAFRRGHPDPDICATWLQLRRDVLAHNVHSPLLKEHACWYPTEYMNDGHVHLDWHTLTLYPPEIWHNTIDVWDVNAAYDVIAHNPIIRQHFERQGYELEFRSAIKKILTPHCYQAILLGALGEEAITAVLQHARITLEAVPDPLFEVIDLKLAGLPWYIDCKNYSERTLEQFTLTTDDPGWRPKLNTDDFIRLAQQKLTSIQTFHEHEGAVCKLMYMNLVGHDLRGNQYFDAHFNEVATLDHAAIVVMQGVISYDDPKTINHGMHQIIHAIQTTLAK